MIEKLNFFKESPENLDFEHQFKSKKNIGDLDIYQAKPENQKSNSRVLFAPGWARGKDSIKEPMKVIFDEGREVVSVSHARIGGEKVPYSLKEYTDVESIKARSLQKALEITNNGHTEKTSVIAHSEGAINAIIAALKNPDAFKSLVLVNPVGMIGEDNYEELKERFNREKTREKAVEGKDYKKNKNFLKYVAKNFIRTLNEAKATSEIQIQDYLRFLKDRGIGISIIAGVDDEAFPMDRMQKIANTEILDGFYSVKEGHNKIYNEPKKYMKVALEALEALEKKHDIHEEEQKEIRELLEAQKKA